MRGAGRVFEEVDQDVCQFVPELLLPVVLEREEVVLEIIGSGLALLCEQRGDRANSVDVHVCS